MRILSSRDFDKLVQLELHWVVRFEREDWFPLLGKPNRHQSRVYLILSIDSHKISH